MEFNEWFDCFETTNPKDEEFCYTDKCKICGYEIKTSIDKFDDSRLKDHLNMHILDKLGCLERIKKENPI